MVVVVFIKGDEILYCEVDDTKRCSDLIMNLCRAGIIGVSLNKEDFEPTELSKEVTEEELLSIAYGGV